MAKSSGRRRVISWIDFIVTQRYHKASKGINIMALKQKRVGIWLQVSTEDQVKGESLEVYERRASAYAEAKGWEVMEV
jgi:hypothetical protein